MKLHLSALPLLPAAEGKVILVALVPNVRGDSLSLSAIHHPIRQPELDFRFGTARLCVGSILPYSRD